MLFSQALELSDFIKLVIIMMINILQCTERLLKWPFSSTSYKLFNIILFFGLLGLVVLTSTNEVVQGLWNTIAAGNGILSTPGAGIGHHYTTEIPENAVDQNRTTKYTNFGACNNTLNGSIDCGTNTGFFLTLRRDSSLLVAIRFRTANSYP